MRLATGLLAALMLAAVASCADDDPPPAAAPTTSPSTTSTVTTVPGDLEVRVERDRLFEQRRAVAVDFVGHGEVPVEVSEIQLVTGLFEPVPPEDRTVTVQPSGDPIRAPVAYGPAVCPAAVDRTVTVRYRRDGEPSETFVGAVSERIRRAHVAECAAQDAARRVTLSFADDWVQAGPSRAAGTVVVEPVGDSEVEIVDLVGSVVLTVVVEGSLPTSNDVRVVATAARCDSHALIESKRTYTLTARVRLDGGAPVTVELDARDTAAQPVIDRAIEGCVAGA